MKNPTQCILWKKRDLSPADLDLELKETYVREPRLKRSLFRCRECGQLYFHEWYEHTNFNHDNFMYETYIPVENEEDIKTLLKTKNSEELSHFFPQLHGSFTNGLNDTVQWIEQSDN